MCIVSGVSGHCALRRHTLNKLAAYIYLPFRSEVVGVTWAGYGAWSGSSLREIASKAVGVSLGTCERHWKVVCV